MLSYKEQIELTLFLFYLKKRVIIVLTMILFSAFLQEGIAQCSSTSFGCNSSLNISTDENCVVAISPSQVFANYSSLASSCTDLLNVHVTDEFDNLIGQGEEVIINLSSPITISIGDSIKVTVFQDDNGNNMFDDGELNCWGGARVEDKLPPVLENCSDTTIYCYESLGNIVGGPIFPIQAQDGCSLAPLTPSLVDSTLTLLNCDPSIKGTLVKTWEVTDASNNTATCTQIITILRLPTTGITIDAPDDVNLECNSNNSPDISPNVTGYPKYTFTNINSEEVTIELTPANTAGLCSDIKVLPFQDVGPLATCGGGEKYIRTFTILDWCTGGTLAEVVQQIEISDTQAPIFICPNDMVVNTTANSCGGTITLPSLGITDACGSAPYYVSIMTPVGNFTANGGQQITNVPLGTHTITYNVEDACGNSSSCSFELTVNDNIAPIPICDEHTIVSLNNIGEASVPAITFDDGSWDNCGSITYEVRRMASSCFAATPFSDFVGFTCCDLGDTVMVELRVTDLVGNTNSCMVEVEVQDKLNPQIICPQNKTIACGSDTSALVLGMAVGIDNCGSPNVTWINSGDIDPTCGEGVITRTWTVTDAQGLTASCIQTITIENNSLFTGNTNPNDVDDIQFPDDVMGANAISCVDFQNDPSLIDPSNTGEPVIIGNINGCSMVGTTTPDDLVFELGTGGCMNRKILRKWAVVDWCQAGNAPDLTQNGPGVWIHVQVIMVTDTEAPVLTSQLADFTVAVGSSCVASVTLPNIPEANIQDCSSNINVSVTNNLGGSGFGPFTVSTGTYEAVYFINDGCGNMTTDTINIFVIDESPPVPICQSLSSAIMMTLPNDGEVTIHASSFVLASSTDNCTSPNNLAYTVILDSLNNINAAPVDTTITFTCDDVGITNVAIWVCDTASTGVNCTYCVVQVNIVSNNVFCNGNGDNPGGGGGPLIAGIIDNELGQGVEDVEVDINNGTYMEMTNVNGYFNVDNLSMNTSYNIKPSKDTNPRNGVTTFDLVLIRKHILGMELLDSPYKIIAADVNGSGEVTALDIVQIRSLILLTTDEFPNGMPSWRFVDQNYVFPNALNPWEEVFPEEKDVQSLNSTMDDMNFVAIKLGDVTESATPNLLQGTTRNNVGELNFYTQNKWIKKGEVGSLIFETNEKDLAAWQFTLSFDNQLIELVEMEKVENIHFGNLTDKDDALTFSWNVSENAMLETKHKWFKIQFLAKENLQTEEAISISSNLTSAIGYNEEGEEYDVKLKFEEEEKLLTDEFKLYQNAPNPFVENTSIRYYLPKESEIEITVYDLTGKLLKSYCFYSSQGNQNFVVKKEDLKSDGVLYYQLKSPEYQASGKMILLP